MSKEVVIAGGTGFIGKKLINLFRNIGFDVSVLSRNKAKAEKFLPDFVNVFHWDFNHAKNLVDIIEKKFAVVNLSGASIAEKIWTNRYKNEIVQSRMISTRKIVEAVNLANNPPEVFFNASAVGYYGHTGDKIIDENSLPGDDFLANLCIQWEKEALSAQNKTRVVLGRTGLVLDAREGALPKLLMSTKFFTTVIFGNGKQWYPWIHIDDEINMIAWALENKNVFGPINLVSPNPVTMKGFSGGLGKLTNSKLKFKIPEFILSSILGERASVVLSGQRAIPAKAQDLGYKFKFPNLEEALKSILEK